MKLGWVHIKANSSYQPQKRFLALSLLGFTGFAVANSQLSCPVWSAGCACPTCGITRATKALFAGDVQLAFFYQIFFPYWLFIAAAIGLSFLAYVVGLTQHADQLGKKVLDSIPAPLHYSIWLMSLLVNWYQYGINTNGWLTLFVQQLLG